MQQLTEYELVARAVGRHDHHGPRLRPHEAGHPRAARVHRPPVGGPRAQVEPRDARRRRASSRRSSRRAAARSRRCSSQEGTLRVGDALVTGSHYGRVRAMMNERGEQVDDVGPGYPVEVLGLSGVPIAGDEFNVVEDEKAAKEVAEHRAAKARPEGARRVTKRRPSRTCSPRPRPAAARTSTSSSRRTCRAPPRRSRRRSRRPPTKKVGREDPRLRRRRRHRVRRPHRRGGQGHHRRVQHEARDQGRADREPAGRRRSCSSTSSTRRSTRSARRWRTSSSPIIKEKPLGKAEVRALFNIPKSRAPSPARR